jgi:hypothetical protein
MPVVVRSGAAVRDRDHARAITTNRMAIAIADHDLARDRAPVAVAAVIKRWLYSRSGSKCCFGSAAIATRAPRQRPLSLLLLQQLFLFSSPA